MKLIIFIAFMLFIWVKTENSQNCTQSNFNNLLSRRKRFLTYPDGSSFAVKRSFSKAIIDNRPKGLNLNIDCGIYYPLPGSKDPWNPAKFLYRLDLARIDGLSATEKPVLKPKVDVNEYSMKENIDVVNVNNRHPDLYYPSKYHWSEGNRKASWHGTEYFNKPVAPEWNQKRKNYLKQYHPALNGELLNVSRSGPYYSRFSPPRTLSGVVLRPAKTHFENSPWLHHREYRERREIYAHSEGLGHIFGINMKACMMRAICEMNEDSLPPGKSFILDVAHILFDLPTDQDFNDDYGNIAKEKNIDCAKRFYFTCPYSPMQFLMHNVRLNSVKDPISIKNSNVYV